MHSAASELTLNHATSTKLLWMTDSNYDATDMFMLRFEWWVRCRVNVCHSSEGGPHCPHRSSTDYFLNYAMHLALHRSNEYSQNWSSDHGVYCEVSITTADLICCCYILHAERSPARFKAPLDSSTISIVLNASHARYAGITAHKCFRKTNCEWTCLRAVSRDWPVKGLLDQREALRIRTYRKTFPSVSTFEYIGSFDFIRFRSSC